MKDNHANFILTTDEIDTISMACMSVASNRLKTIKNQDYNAIIELTQIKFWHGHFEAIMRNSTHPESKVWLNSQHIAEITKILNEYQNLTPPCFLDRVEKAKDTEKNLWKQSGELLQ